MSEACPNIKMPAIPPEEIADLFRKVIRGESCIVAVGTSWDDCYAGNCVVRIDGYELIIFNDCFELDYVDRATAPDGRVTDFEEWCDVADSITNDDDPVARLTSTEVAAMETALETAEVVTL